MLRRRRLSSEGVYLAIASNCTITAPQRSVPGLLAERVGRPGAQADTVTSREHFRYANVSPFGSPRGRCSGIFICSLGNGILCVERILTMAPCPFLETHKGAVLLCRISCTGIPFLHLQQSNCCLLNHRICTSVEPCKSRWLTPTKLAAPIIVALG